ncbi:MAG: ABC transporter substrate-binding protein [Chloroflexi bacterium]|nr:ABC transporter substrate-binding protein [Chloroflexota bacterium]
MRKIRLLTILALLAIVLVACGTETITVEVPGETIEVEVPGETITIIETVEVAGETVEVEVPADVVTVRINMGYIPDVQYAPFYVGIEKGFFLEEGIILQMDYSSEVDGISLVGAGDADFATGAGDLLIQARSQGVPVKYIVRWYNGIPSSIFSLASSGIETPADLAGKTLGIPGFYGINYKSLLSTLASNGLTMDDMTVEDIGYTQVAAVSEGLVDAAVGYSNNEPHQLRFYGMDVNVIEMDEWGNFVPIGIMASEDMINNNPELVQAFVRAFLRSLQATLDDPEFALEAAMSGVGFATWNLAQTEMQLAASMGFWEVVDDELGYYSSETFEWTQEFLLNAGEMDSEIDVTEAYTNEFVEGAQP